MFLRAARTRQTIAIGRGEMSGSEVQALDATLARLRIDLGGRTTATRSVAFAVLIAASGFGLYTSFRYHLASWGLDPDSLQAGIVWLGVRAHGFAFIVRQSYSPDNWLFSVLLPSIPIFELFGPESWIAIGIGWLSFVVTVGMAGAITMRLGGGPLASLGVVACLLLSHRETFGRLGFLSHPASHDITLSWGLASLILFHSWLSSGRRSSLASGTVVLTADCLSDPWAVVGVAAPCLIAALAALVFPGIRRRAAGCTAAVAIALGLAQTRILGAFWFLPVNTTGFGDWSSMRAHLVLLGRSVAGMFNPLPISLEFMPALVAPIVCCVVLMTGWGTVVLLRASMTNAVRCWLTITVALSAVLPCAAIIISDIPGDPMIGRFVVSLVVLAPVIVFGAIGVSRGRVLRAARYGVPAFFCSVVLAGSINGAPVWLRSWQGLHTNGVPGLTRFLAGRGLRFGYGEYWGAEANAVTFYSRGAVTIRPVSFDAQSGRVRSRGGSPFWYGARNTPITAGRYFIAFDDDGENCQSIRVCSDGVQRQFGPASGRYAYGKLVILAWDHPIVVD